MRIRAILVGLLATIIAAPAFAAKPSKEEGIGAGLGATIGGFVGGPPGIIIGAAFGAKVGDELYQRDHEADRLSENLAASQSRVHKLENDVAHLGSDLERLREVSRPELLNLMQAGIEMDLLFRTDEHVLADTTGARLEQLAKSLATMPDVRLRLDGFADERGDEEYNRKLSNKRAEHVRDVLIANGIPASRIDVNAHGESKAADDNIDSFAFERRVSLTLYVSDAQSFAATPE